MQELLPGSPEGEVGGLAKIRHSVFGELVLIESVEHAKCTNSWLDTNIYEVCS